jgi:protein ImuB
MLAALPEPELIARLGPQAKRLRQMARGELPHLFQPALSPISLEERMELDSPVEILESLLFVVRVMLEQLIARAHARALALAAITITLRLENVSTHSRTVRPALPSNDLRLWLKLLQLDLEAHPPAAAITGLTIAAEPGKQSKVQLGLFAPQLPESGRLDITLARIRAIVGEGNVGRAMLRDSLQPEAFRPHALRVEKFQGQQPQTKGSSLVPSPFALRIIRPPEGIFLTMHDHRPEAFVFHEKKYAVEHAYGPWHFSGEWWHGELWNTEQWDLIARAPEGSSLCCCVVRDVAQNLWQMAALYD